MLEGMTRLELRRTLATLGRRAAPTLGALLSGAGALMGCALGLSHPTPPAGSASVQELEAYVREAIADGDPPSISIAVSHGGQLVYERALGYADTPRAVRCR